jgi:hypothetical protein
VALAKGHDRAVGLIEESVLTVPELGIFPFRTITGTSFDTLVRTSLPTASFTAANAGVAASKSTFDRRRVECFLAQSRIEMAKHVVDSAEEGAAWWQAVEASGAAISAMRKVASQIYYGTATDSKGFPGLKEATPVAGTGGVVTNATGTTGSTASSAYFVSFGTQGVTLVGGRDSTMNLSPFIEETITDAAGLSMPGYTAHLSAWVGLQLVNTLSVSRIYNLTADSGKGLTDALIATHLSKLKDGYRPSVILVSKRSLLQLQAARTPVIHSGPGDAAPSGRLGLFAPTPTHYEGIPIIATDSILDTDAIGS